MAFLLIFSMVLGLLDQLQIFWQLRLTELQRFYRSEGTQSVTLDISKVFDRFWHAVFFRNLSLMEIQVRYLALFLLFLVKDGLEWFLMGSLNKNIQLILEFLKAPFLAIQFFCYTLMTLFLMMVSVILVSMQMILLSTLSVIRHLIFGNNLNRLLNLNLIYETLWFRAGSGLLISVLEKLIWFCLTGLITLVLLMWKWMGLFLRKNHLLRWWHWLFLLNWIGAVTLSLLLKVPLRKLEPWLVLWSFFLLRLLCVMSELVLAVSIWHC